MSDNEINVAIAEACEWKSSPDEFYADGLHWTHPAMGQCATCDLPNYCADLNAMHEAEEGLFKSKPGYYERFWLTTMQDVLGWESDVGVIDKRQACEIAHATARQRAEAFLRTVGKWQEQEKGR